MIRFCKLFVILVPAIGNISGFTLYSNVCLSIRGKAAVLEGSGKQRYGIKKSICLKSPVARGTEHVSAYFFASTHVTCLSSLWESQNQNHHCRVFFFAKRRIRLPAQRSVQQQPPATSSLDSCQDLYSESYTILRAATHTTELGYHDLCLSRSHYQWKSLCL